MIIEENIKDASKGPKFPAKNGDFWVFQIYSKQEILLSKFLHENKIYQNKTNNNSEKLSSKIFLFSKNLFWE